METLGAPDTGVEGGRGGVSGARTLVEERVGWWGAAGTRRAEHVRLCARPEGGIPLPSLVGGSGEGGGGILGCVSQVAKKVAPL